MASTGDRVRDRTRLLENFVRIAIEGRAFSHAVVAHQEAAVDARSGMLPPSWSSSSPTVTVDCDRCGETPLTHWFSHATQLYGRAGASGQTTVDLCGACRDDVRRLATEIVPTRGDLLKRVRQLSAPHVLVEPATRSSSIPSASSSSFSSSSSSASILASLAGPAGPAAAVTATNPVVPPTPPIPHALPPFAPSSNPWPPFIPSGVAAAHSLSPTTSPPVASALFWPRAFAPTSPFPPAPPALRGSATSGERHVWPPPSPYRNTADSLFVTRTSAHTGGGDGGRW